MWRRLIAGSSERARLERTGATRGRKEDPKTLAGRHGATVKISGSFGHGVEPFEAQTVPDPDTELAPRALVCLRFLVSGRGGCYLV